MELMVYIAILGIVVLVAGQAFSNSTKFRVRTTNMLKANDVSERIVEMFSEDISQMGAKTYKKDGGALNPDKFEKVSAVFMDTVGISGGKPDSSSFAVNEDRDSLTTRRIRYSDAGDYEAVEEVAWFKRGKSLYRSCKSIALNEGVTAPDDCPEENSPDVLIADHVDTFEIFAAKPNVLSDVNKSAAENSIVLPLNVAGTTERRFRLVPRFGETSGETSSQVRPLTFDPPDGGVKQTLSGFYGNYDDDPDVLAPKPEHPQTHQVFVALANTGVSVQSGDYWKDACSKVTLDSLTEYEISFKVLYNADDSRLFCPGRDHAAVGFRKVDGSTIAGLDDFLFYAPVTIEEPEKRSFRFNVNQTVRNVCVAFTFASYSPAPNGKISISNFILKKVENSNYDFSNATISPADKQNVKALKLHLVVNLGNETSNISQTIAVPSNGPRD